MAVVTRYFSTTGAGAADGTTWADRAALFSAGNWSTVITGFNFGGTDSLKCLIGPGSYTCSQALASATFSVAAPTDANPLILHGCDSSGNALAPENPNWTSDTPVDWDTNLPVIATTTNVSTLNHDPIVVRLVKFTASGRNGVVIQDVRDLNWVVIEQSTAHVSAAGCSAGRLANISIEMSGSSYDYAATTATGSDSFFNVRVEGVAGSTGDRDGLQVTSSLPTLVGCTVTGVGGIGIDVQGGAGVGANIVRCVVRACGGDGIELNSTASQTDQHIIDHCMVTGNGGYGIDAQSAARLVLVDTRLRDNTSGNLNGLGNYPDDMGIYTTDSDDASEYVDSANGDFRIKNSATIWGSGYGVSEQAAAAGGGSPKWWG